jgi:hypothetical protein
MMYSYEITKTYSFEFRELVNSPFLTQWHVDNQIKVSPEQKRALFYMCAERTQQELKDALKKNDIQIKIAAASNFFANDAVLEEAMLSKFWDVRYAAVKHPNCPVSALRIALDDPIARISEWAKVAFRAPVSASARKDIEALGVSEKIGLARNTSTTLDILSKFGEVALLIFVSLWLLILHCQMKSFNN